LNLFTKPVIWPYELFSQSGATLAGALCTKRVRTVGRYWPKQRDLIINWGNPEIPNWWRHQTDRQVLNHPQYVRNASNKVATFDILGRAGSPVVPFTTDINQARQWFNEPIYGKKINAVVCRALTRANSGRGITLAKSPNELVSAPLFTRYQPKTSEYRIHVWNGLMLDAQEKRRVNGFDELTEKNPYIRNHPNGWVFCREDVEVPDEIEIASIEAVARLGLHFGAVDIGWHPEFGVGIYEVNTAPGIEGQTLINYANKIRGELYVRRT